MVKMGLKAFFQQSNHCHTPQTKILLEISLIILFFLKSAFFVFFFFLRLELGISKKIHGTIIIEDLILPS